MPRDPVDFNTIEPRYREIHGRLENWARSLRSPGHAEVAPMFRLYRSTEQWVPPETGAAVDVHDAHRIGKGVLALPQDHRIAIQWFYVRPTSPKRTCQLIGCNMRGLDDLVRSGRSMLVNRRV